MPASKATSTAATRPTMEKRLTGLRLGRGHSRRTITTSVLDGLGPLALDGRRERVGRIAQRPQPELADPRAFARQHAADLHGVRYTRRNLRNDRPEPAAETATLAPMRMKISAAKLIVFGA